MIDRIGDDWRGELVRREYASCGVDTTHLILEPDKTTTFGSVMVRKHDGERHVIFFPGDFTPLQGNELPVELLRSTEILHLNGRHWPACIDAAKLVRESGGQVSFDGGANRFEERFLKLLPLVDILIVARDFAEKLSGSTDREVQFAALSKWNASVTGVTDGENGSWVSEINDDQIFHQPAEPIENVIDTTGCGDVYHGAFLTKWSQGSDARCCAKFASLAAAKNATALGGRGHLPERSEIEG